LQSPADPLASFISQRPPMVLPATAQAAIIAGVAWSPLCHAFGFAVTAELHSGLLYELRLAALQSTANAIPLWQTAAASTCGCVAGAAVVLLISGQAASKECKECKAFEEAEAAPLAAKAGERGEEPSLWAPALVMVFSIPALLGTCCWPLLVAGLLGMAQLSTVSSRALSHAASFGLNIGMFGALLPQLAGRTAARRGDLPPCRRWAPFCMVVLGAALVMLDLTRHMLLDLGYGDHVLPMYKEDGSLTAVGKAGVVCTWSGVALIFVGVAMLTDIPKKLGLV